MILGGGEGQSRIPVAQDEIGDFLAKQTVFNNNLRPRIAQATRGHHGNGLFGLLDGLGNDHAFACGQAIGFDNDGRTTRAHIGLGFFGIGKARIGGGGHMRFITQRFGKGFGSFKLGGGLRRAKNLDPCSIQRIRQTPHQRRFGTDDYKADLLAAAKGNDG